jgi:hypothetical protein
MLSKGVGKKWYAWTVASPRAVYHRILDSRSTATAREVLGDYHGSVVADGYEPYQTVARAGPDGVARYTLAFCWAHVRGKYVKAEPFAPTCAEAIELIGKLYEIERDPPNPHHLTRPGHAARTTTVFGSRWSGSAPDACPAEDQDILEFHGCKCNTRRIVGIWMAGSIDL